MKTITYIYRGGIERGTGRRGRSRLPGSGYRWVNGYSENSSSGGILYPWMTRRECQSDARANGAKAVFEIPAGPLPKGDAS